MKKTNRQLLGLTAVAIIAIATSTGCKKELAHPSSEGNYQLKLVNQAVADSGAHTATPAIGKPTMIIMDTDTSENGGSGNDNGPKFPPNK